MNQEKRLEHTASNQLQNVDSILPYIYSAHPFIAFFFLPLRFSFFLFYSPSSFVFSTLFGRRCRRILRSFLWPARLVLPIQSVLVLCRVRAFLRFSLPQPSLRIPSCVTSFLALPSAIVGRSRENKKHREDKTTKVADEILLLHHLDLFWFSVFCGWIGRRSTGRLPDHLSKRMFWFVSLADHLLPSAAIQSYKVRRNIARCREIWNRFFRCEKERKKRPTNKL